MSSGDTNPGLGSGDTNPGLGSGGGSGLGSGGASGPPDDERDDMGHGIVNDGPDKAQADDLFGGDDPFGDDELALRRLLQGAVADLEPTDGALDHLRRAVPARRARKRQAIVGIAAAVVLIGTAVPAFVHVANSGGTSADQAINAGHGEQAQGGTGAETGVEGGEKGADTPTGAVSPSQGAAEGAGKPAASASGETDGEEPGSKPPADAQPDASPVCEAAQLGVSSVRAGAPDAEGKVYGTFRIANVSGRECVVSGAGRVDFATKGAADPSKIMVVSHTPGDAASGLPDPSQESPTLLLAPDNAYEVRFAWVPKETCPTTGTSPDPTAPTDAGGTSSGSTGSTDSGSASNDASTQLGAEDGTPAEGSVEVSHTAEPGAPAAAATIPHACAGTIYRTGVLDAS
ncbi:hypothetical protein [Streptomyces sp. NPDC006551]|uniref:hypothetical protein n=1 Tax=Streptomyces sp. NPDC006551 TaxID=3157178 RepID=UPI0033B23003